ncbi:hypothetical protein ABL78_0644 [Leptomonas seymouri]|uniref:CS domain-containing protein n=1 Tax=Leptomonas seymouri TaxID=5684 RepID=A0A0N1PE56_LEPSE|nr:hypothetical protein ABL78_0644 [Leptomonas seymouri]|eukprot:KPI90262.1 hypothetical protein ABL78_0644 [Leptomonas seymouri]
MSRIDYSKWDKFECSSSGGSDESNNSDEESDSRHHTSGNHGPPTVTRLEYPTCVSLGPSGVQLAKAPTKASASPFNPTAPPAPQKQSEGNTGGMKASETFCRSSSPHENAVRAHLDEERIDAADDDEDLLYESLARNGGREGAQHWWSQTEDCAIVSFHIPWDTTAKDVTEFHLHEIKDEESKQYRAQLDVTIQVSFPHADPAVYHSGTAGAISPPAVMHICKQFRYPIKLSEELVEGCWQLHRMSQRRVRLLVIEVFKEPIGQGLTLWWDRCFVSDTASVIDTQSIPDRVQRTAATGMCAREKAEQFRKVWDEAHEEFRRRRRERKAEQ